MDRVTGQTFQLDPGQHQRCPAGGQPQTRVGAVAVSHLGQVALHQGLDVGVRQIGQGVDAVRPQDADLADVQRRLADPEAQVVVAELRLAGLPPGAVVALAHDDRRDHRTGITARPGALAGDLGHLEAETELVVVALQRAAQLPTGGRGAREGAQELLAEVDPGDHVLTGRLVGADQAGDRGQVAGPSGGLQHAPAVRQLQQVALPGGLHREVGDAERAQRATEMTETVLEASTDVHLERAVAFHEHRPVSGAAVTLVVTAHEDIAVALAVTVGIRGQTRPDDDAVTACDRLTGLEFALIGVTEQRAQVDGPRRRGQVVEHVVPEGLATGEEFLERLVGLAGDRFDRPVVTVLRLDRAGTRRVGVEEDQGCRHGGVGQAFQPRCSATMPWLRLRQPTAFQPASAIRSASSSWCFQAMTDSKRYS